MATEIVIENNTFDVAVTELNNSVTINETNLTVDVTEQVLDTVVTISNDQGPQGLTGNTGATGATGAASTVAGPAGTNGQGVPVGGTTNQALVKIDGTDYNTQWATPAATGVTSVSATAPLSTGGSPITSTGTITIADATTSVKGAVQLSNSTSTTSSVLAATSTAVKSAYDRGSQGVDDAFTAYSLASGALRSDGTNSMGGTLDLSNNDIINVKDITSITTKFQGPTSVSQITNSTNSSAIVTFPSNNGQLVGTGDTGVVTSTMITDGTIVNADINASAAIAATKIAGTAYTTTRKKIDDSALTASLDIVSRSVLSGARIMSNGVLYFTLFTPAENFTMTNFSVYSTTAGTDTGGTSVRRMGLFTTSGTNNATMTLVARTASDATLGNAASTIYTRALNTTGGYPASYNLVAGTTYAFGMLCYNTGGTFGSPSFAALTDQFPVLTPYRVLNVTGQTDLPITAVTGATGNASAVFARLT